VIDDDPFTEHFMSVGKHFSALMGWGSIEKCNCLVRYGSSDEQTPAIRRGEGKNAKFFTPEGCEIAKPTSWENMPGTMIARRMKERGEVYIGHMFTSFGSSVEGD
jgi:hypothetical protein